MIHRAGSSSFYSLIVSLLLIAFVLPPAPVQAASTRPVAPTEMAGDAFAPAIQTAQQSAARGVIAGEVFDAATGLPLADADVRLISPDGAPTPMPATTTDARGRYRLVASPGLARIAIDKPGYSSAERTAQVVDRQRVAPIDARLTPLDPNSALVSAFGGGSVATSSGDAVLLIPPGGLIDDQVMQLTAIGVQGLVGVPPAGWSPLAAVEISPISATFVQSATLSIAAPAGLSPDAAPTAAHWDATQGAWTVLGPPVRTADGLRFQISASAPGQVALFLADAVNGPPTPVTGAPLPGAADPGLPPDASATISPSPQILVTAPGVTSDVQVQAGAATPLTSGTAMRLDLRESYRFVNGTQLHPEPMSQDLRLYAYPAGQFASQAGLTLSPSRIFAVHELEQGVIDLAVRPATSAAQGILLTNEGATVETPAGQRLVVPRNATLVDLPLLLTPQPQAEFPPIIPAELTFLDAVTVDFHGGRLALPATLSISTPPTLPASSQVLVAHLVEVQNVTYLSLVGPASRSTAGRLQFSGLLDEGRYVFLAASQPLGFVTGTINNADGQSQAGMIATLDAFPLASISTPEGRYILAAPPGPVTVTIRNPLTSDVVTRAVTISGVGSFASLNIGLTPQPPSVVAVSPADGAVDVPLISVVQVTFSEPVNPLTVLDALTVADANGAALAGSQSLTPEGTVLTFRPDTILADSATYSLTVSAAVQDLAGNPLTEVFRARFTTVDVTPPTLPPAGQISVTIPDASGFCTVSGTQGTVQPDWVVIVKNRTTNALTSVLPNADGSFSLNVAASPADKLDLILQDAAGNQVTTPLPRYRNPDGTVVVGSEGGPVDGPGGEVVDIPANALPPGTLVKVGSVAEGDLPQPAPPGYPFLGGVDLQMSNDASKPLVLSIPAPADADPDDIVIVAKHVTWPKGQGWMVVEQAFLDNGKYTTAPPASASGKVPGLAKMVFQAAGTGIGGITASGEYAFMRVNGDCVTLVKVNYSLSMQFIIVSPTAPFVFAPILEASIAIFPVVCNELLELELRDPNTDRLIQRISQRAPSKHGASVGAFTTDDTQPPRIIQHNLYNNFLQDHLRIHFSKTMSPTTVLDGLSVVDQFGEVISGTAAMGENNSMVVFTPTAPLQMDTQYSVFIAGATDTKAQGPDKPGNELVMNDPIRFTTFKPQRRLELDALVGTAPGNQAVDAIRNFVFVIHSEVTSSLQLLTVLNTAVLSTTTPAATQGVSTTSALSQPVVIGASLTGLRHVRAIAVIPDVFATLKKDEIEPLGLIAPTITATVLSSITSALDKNIITDTLAAIFDAYDDEPLPNNGGAKKLSQRLRLSDKAIVTVKEPGSEWLIENRDDIYLVRREDNQLKVLAGRDLLVMIGTTEVLVGGMEILEIWDVTGCTKPPLDQSEAEKKNCVNPAKMTISRKVLTDPRTTISPYLPYANNHFIPREIGVPTKLAVLNDRLSDAAVVYVVNSGIGLQAVDVTKAANMPYPLLTDPAPHALRRGRYNDVAVVKNLVLATEVPNSGGPRLALLTAGLDDKRTRIDGSTHNLPTLPFAAVFGVSAAPNVIYDMDRDGNLGAAEEQDELDANGDLLPNAQFARDELFDLALVSTGMLASGKGIIWVIDLNTETDLWINRYSDYVGSPRIVAGIPITGPLRSIQFDPKLKLAYAEVDGEGITVINLRDLIDEMASTRPLVGSETPDPDDENKDGRDDRLIGVYQLARIANRAEIAVGAQPDRPLAYLHDYNAGIELVQVCNTCTEMTLDFNGKDSFVDQQSTKQEDSPEESSGSQTPAQQAQDDLRRGLLEEKQVLLALLEGAAISMTQLIPTMTGNDFYMMEQGSGGCFWNDAFDGNPTAVCRSFNPGSSDHDFEVFVPTLHVKRAQDVLDAYVRNPPSHLKALFKKLDDLSFYAMPKEPFESGLLLNSPPMNKEGDTAGDLGMGRQTLLLLWLMTAGGYAELPAYRGWEHAPDLDKLLDCVARNEMFDVAQDGCDGTPPMYVGEPTGIPRLEGYEWSVLQEYNIYKTGALVQLKGACDFSSQKDETDSPFVAPNVDEMVALNHPDRAFDDSDAFNSQCKSQLRTIAKAAIRTTLARLLADDYGNILVTDGRTKTETLADGTQQLLPNERIDFTRDNVMGPNSRFCLTELGPNGDPANPTTDALKYQDKRCEGFEEFIASMAIESVRMNLTVFSPSDLPLIWRFWCVKVWSGCEVDGIPVKPIQTEADALKFIQDVIQFVERVQQDSRPVYYQTRATDSITVTALMTTMPQAMTTYPFIKDICQVCANITGQPFTEKSTRDDLRLCNLQSVLKKINGKHRDEALQHLGDDYLLLPDKETLNQLKADLGVRNYVLHNLRVRASNISALDLYSVTVSLYSGDGRSTEDYNLETEYTLPYLPAGGRTLVDVQTVDKKPITVEPITGICASIPLTESTEFLGTPKKKENVNIFPALFVPPIMLEKLGTEADSYGALAFVIDPDQDFAEIDKQNNQATLYYSVITRTAPLALPTTPDLAPFVITEFEPNDICLVPTLPLEIDFTLAAGSDISQPGAQYLSVPVFTPATQIIRVANRGAESVRNGRLLVNGEEIAANLVITPGGSLIQTREIVPKQGGPQTFVAEIMGIDDEGNSVGPASDKAIINGLRNSQAFEITLYDASPLAKQEHPWSRWNLHWDYQTGETLPVVGAVTDGAALLRLDVRGLSPTEPVTVTIKDVTVRGATDGLGKLEVLDSMGATISQGVRVISDGLTIVIDNPVILGVQGNVHYRPPSGFVRPDHSLQDTYLHPAAVNAPIRPPRLTREVDVRFDQQQAGYATQRIRLKRPPVFLFHGYGGDPTVWNKFRPIVPPPCTAVSTSPPPAPTGVFIGCGGVSLKPNRFVPGYDSRFMVFAAGSSPTILSFAEEAKGNYWRFTAALQNDALKDYAIAGVDVIANSMGGLITREIARQFVKDLNLPTPIHKLITIGTPHLGSPVANKVIENRDKLALEFDFDPLRFTYKRDAPSYITNNPTAMDFIKANKCSILLKSLGSGKIPTFAGLNSYAGAAIDLQEGSAAVNKLQDAGVLIPSHYIIGEIDNADLAARAFNEGGINPSEIAMMWLGLGLFCNWTPDQMTVDTTKALRSSGTALFLAARLVAFTPNDIRDALAMLKEALGFATEDPEPLLPIGNDRVVPVPSQRDGLGPLADVMTVIRGDTDHLDIKETNVDAFQDNAVYECNQFIDGAWAHPNHRPNRTLTDKNQVACLAVFLLDASADSSFFCQPGADCNSAPPNPGFAATGAGDADKGATLTQEASSIATTPSLSPTLDFTATTVLTITSPPAGAIVRPGQRIEVQFAVAPATTLVDVVAGIELAANTSVTPGLSAVVTVPVDAVGTQALSVIAIGENGAIYGNAIDVLIDPGRLRSIAVSAPPLLGIPGQVLPLRILGDYADDVQRDITSADAGTTYASSDETILGITANGLIQARKNGVAILRVVNRNPLTGRAVSAQQRIEVAVPESQANGIPVASATVTPTVPIEKFTYIDGTGSSDPDDDPLSYRWEQTGGPVVVLVDANTATPRFISPRIDQAAVLSFELTVRDDKGASSLPFPVQVTVVP